MHRIFADSPSFQRFVCKEGGEIGRMGCFTPVRRASRFGSGVDCGDDRLKTDIVVVGGLDLRVLGVNYAEGAGRQSQGKLCSSRRTSLKQRVRTFW